jgi:hypothetical protein
MDTNNNIAMREREMVTREEEEVSRGKTLSQTARLAWPLLAVAA